ncbi:hypothetical protein MC885_005928, partial [Smutsia gigantea]
PVRALRRARRSSAGTERPIALPPHSGPGPGPRWACGRGLGAGPAGTWVRSRPAPWHFRVQQRARGRRWRRSPRVPQLRPPRARRSGGSSRPPGPSRSVHSAPDRTDPDRAPRPCPWPLAELGPGEGGRPTSPGGFCVVMAVGARTQGKGELGAP